MEQLLITAHVINRMIHDKEFDLQQGLKIAIPSEHASTMILLRLRMNTNTDRLIEQHDYPISGFPRILVAEDERTGLWHP